MKKKNLMKIKLSKIRKTREIGKTRRMSILNRISMIS